MDVPTWVWWTTIIVTMSVLLFDVVVIGRRPHEPSTKEVSVALGIYVGLAVVFGIAVWVLAGHRYGTEFFAGWLTEYSLSVDNLFIVIIIMAKFGVPRKFQQEALMVGIVLALVMRGIFIAVGAAAINEFSWIFYLFGIFLVWTAYKLAREGASDDDEYEENRLIKWAESHLPATDQWHGAKILAREGGKRVVTPMFIVILALGTTDLLFALDSIPAIYGLTKEPYLVLTANIFALMGLRQLYFLIGGLLQRLVYLSYGLAVLLGFIGLKLILHAMHENELPFVNGGEHITWAPDIPILVSLGVIVGVLVVTTVVSLIASKHGVETANPVASALGDADEVDEVTPGDASDRDGDNTDVEPADRS
ncbi:MAG: TerC family protein [Nocardioidaceae bacterium]